MRILRTAGLVLVGAVVLTGIAVGAALGYRIHRQQQNHDALRISSANGIEQGGFVTIGGLRQWIQIRGQDRSNPVILFVHGGPAMSMIPFTYRSMQAWEKFFTIVQWDQRGAGRTYELNGGADATAAGMDQIIDDGAEVADYARNVLHQKRIILLGESYGSAIALEMARGRPDLFYACVGTGQLVDEPRAQRLTYQLLLQRVRAQHDEKATRELVAIGPPPYADASRRVLEQGIEADNPAASERNWGPDFLFAPGYSLRDIFQTFIGASRHRSKLVAEDLQYQAVRRGSHFEVPVFFFQGSEDIQAPLELAAEYMAAITAPRKALVVLPGGGHNAFIFYSQRFLEELNSQVRPLATVPPTSVLQDQRPARPSIRAL